MRTLLDILIIVMLLVILAGVLLHQRGDQGEMEHVTTVRDALRTLESRTVYHAALAGAEGDGEVVFPRSIDPGWFGKQTPNNPLATGQRPWIDVAPLNDGSLHPPDPVLQRPGQAGIWYNPARGVFRARVPQQVTDRQTLELYNVINRCELADLPRSFDTSRTPLAMQLPERTDVVRASPDRQATDQISDSAPQQPAPASEKPDQAPRSLRDLHSTAAP
jgi:hypothetical protein